VHGDAGKEKAALLSPTAGLIGRLPEKKKETLLQRGACAGRRKNNFSPGNESSAVRCYRCGLRKKGSESPLWALGQKEKGHFTQLTRRKKKAIFRDAAVPSFGERGGHAVAVPRRGRKGGKKGEEPQRRAEEERRGFVRIVKEKKKEARLSSALGEGEALLRPADRLHRGGGRG